MNRFKVRKERGFSLVELMIVVAIIAILAAIAIPAFMRFAIKSKTAEATGNLSGIRTCEESYRAENDVYIIAVGTPAGGGDDSTPDTWELGGIADFNQIGFQPDGDVRYRYEVGLGTGPNTGAAPSGVTNEIVGSFMVIATSDLDEDGTDGIFTLDSGAPGYPKPAFEGTY